MRTDNGLSTWERMAGLWLDYQQIKHNADLESQQGGANVPDRVDVRTGNAHAQAGVGGGAFGAMSTLHWVGIGVAALLTLGLVTGKFRS